MRCDDVLELQTALLDGELGARESRDVEAHLATCPDCQAKLSDMRDLSVSVRARADYFRAPPELRSRIRAQIQGELGPAAGAAKPARRAPGFALPSWWPSWGVGLAVPVAAALVSFTVGMQVAGPTADGRLLEEALGNHARALLTEHAFDVASSDQHTVKPWFAGKVDFSPPVHDLAADGYPLVGGRLDVLNHNRVAVLAYHRRQHEIDVFIWPVETGASGMSATSRTSRGINTVGWSDGGMNFLAVSDVSPDELQRLKALIRAAAAS